MRFQNNHELSELAVVANVCNPSAQEAEEFTDSLSYRSLSQRKWGWEKQREANVSGITPAMQAWET